MLARGFPFKRPTNGALPLPSRDFLLIERLYKTKPVTCRKLGTLIRASAQEIESIRQARRTHKYWPSEERPPCCTECACIRNDGQRIDYGCRALINNIGIGSYVLGDVSHEVVEAPRVGRFELN